MAPRRARPPPPPAAASPPPARVAAAGHRLPEQLPAGLLLTDVQQRSWRLGPSIGVGAFGEIYSCQLVGDRAQLEAETGLSDVAFAVKVEPHSNGPLFAEMHCYHRVGRPAQLAAWRRRRRLARLGMPRFLGSGSVVYGAERLRFMVIERLGSDLQRLLSANGGRFPVETVLSVGIQVLDTLEYLHSKEYIHADIKAQNLLLGRQPGTENQVYLVDFGLACRFASNGVHKPLRPDLRKAHNGTLEFTSRDAHIGAHSRRGDLEVLGYNLLLWAGGRLPWLHALADAEAVARQKNAFMQRVPALLRACFAVEDAALPAGAEALQFYMEEVALLSFHAPPDYDLLRGLLRAGLRALRGTAAPPAQLNFTCQPTPPQGRRRPAPGRAAQPAAKRRRRNSSGSAERSSGSEQENSDAARGRRPARGSRPLRARAPLRLVSENTPEPAAGAGAGEPAVGVVLEPDDQHEEEVTSPALRSDGKLMNFDWQHYIEAEELTRRRKANPNRSVVSGGGEEPAPCSGDGSGSGSGGRFRVHESLTPAMRAVLLRRLSRRAQKPARKRSKSTSAMLSTSPRMTKAMLEVLALRRRQQQTAPGGGGGGRQSRRSTPGRQSSTPGAAGGSGRSSRRSTPGRDHQQQVGYCTPVGEVVKRRRAQMLQPAAATAAAMVYQQTYEAQTRRRRPVPRARPQPVLQPPATETDQLPEEPEPEPRRRRPLPRKRAEPVWREPAAAAAAAAAGCVLRGRRLRSGTRRPNT